MLQQSIKPTRTSPQSVVQEKDPRAGKYLSFRLGKDDFAIKVTYVREIMAIQDITPVPEAPPFIQGVINLRGKMIPVIDFRRKFGVAEMKFTSRTCIIVVNLESEGEKLKLGGIVDGVSEVLTLQSQDIDNVPKAGTVEPRPYLIGTAKIKNRLRMLVEMSAVLTSQEFHDLESVAI